MKQYRKDGRPSKTFLRYMRKHYQNYISSNIDDIYKAYANPSNIKVERWNCLKVVADSKPYITAYNKHRFTVCYFVYEEDIEYFIVKTGVNTFAIMADLL